MRYEDNIQVDLMKGHITYTDFISSEYLGKPRIKKERVFEVFHHGIYYGTIKIECEDINKGFIGSILRSNAISRFPGMRHHPAHTFTITNPQPWDVNVGRSQSVERGGIEFL